MSAHPLLHLTRVKFLEFVREPEAIFWVLVFPILLSLALGIAFRARTPDPIAIAVQAGPGADEALGALSSDGALRAKILTEAEARESLRTGRVALVVVPGVTLTYWFDPARDESRVARLAADADLQRAAGRSDPRAVQTHEMKEKGSRYIDFLVPGLLGMNLMGTGMWGIGFSIVTARSRGLLKRLVATPMRKRDYLIGQMLGRLVFLFPEVVLLLGFAHLAFDVPLRGSLLALGAVTVAGALAFTGIGLLVAARPRTIEGVSGLMNFVMLPMWIFSGVFFSPSRFPDAIQPAIALLPLTALNDAIRSVMIDGAPLLAVARPVAIVAGWGLAAFLLALRLFRWK
ncbi:MAG TPA: ABC transporter permease [Candidatus Polarisedimenticolaceae bacterium]|nr:ABC transporter permease [Candidatus Polarisedimenticolaceae bacterium]